MIEEEARRVSLRLAEAGDRALALRLRAAEALAEAEAIERVASWLAGRLEENARAPEWEDAVLLAVSLLDKLARIPETVEAARGAIEEVEERWDEAVEEAVKAYRDGRLKEARGILAGFKGRERAAEVEPGTLVDAGVATSEVMAEAGSASQEAELLAEKLEKVAEELRAGGREEDAEAVSEAARAAKRLAAALWKLGLLAADIQVQVDSAYAAVVRAMEKCRATSPPSSPGSSRSGTRGTPRTSS